MFPGLENHPASNDNEWLAGIKFLKK